MIGAYALTPSLWPSLLAFIFLLGLAIYSWQRRDVTAALPLAVGSFLAALWAAGSVLEYAAVDAATKIFWVEFQTVLQLPTATATACFILEYAWPGRWLTRRNLALLSIAPLLLLVLGLTNDAHQLVWRGFETNGEVTPLLGTAGWLFLIYSYTLAILQFVTLVWLYIRSPQHRPPVAIMLFGMTAGRLTYLLEATTVIQSELPLDILAAAFVFLMYAIGLFAFHIFDPISLARQSAFEQLYVGVVILDPEGRVTSINPAAEQSLHTSATRAAGRHFSEVCPAFRDGHLPESGGAEIELSLVTPSAKRYCALTISPLTDWRGVLVGRLLLMRDVTDQKQAQSKIVEQERALAMLEERARLARELHDTLGQVCAFVNTQGQTVRRLLHRGEVSVADEYVLRMVEVSHDADVEIRQMILGLCASPLDQGLYQTLQRFLGQYERTYGIHGELDMPAVFREKAFDPQVEVQLLRILQEALTNVRKHADSPNVRIAFAWDDGFARITIEDTGRGFSPDDGAAGAEFSEHVGLRIMDERAAEVGGTLAVRAVPGQGTTLVVRVPTTISRPALEEALA